MNLVLVFGCLVASMSQPWFGLTPARDTALGRYSYPLYLTHWLAGGIAAGVFYAGQGRHHKSPGDWVFLALGLGVAFLLSWLLIRGVDRPIERMRDRVRGEHPPSRTKHGS